MIELAIAIGLLVFMIVLLSLSYIFILALFTVNRKGSNEGKRVEVDD